MKHSVKIIALASALALAGCNLNTQDRMVVGGLAGAAAGLITANAISANPSWTVLTVLAGAAAGTLVARNTAQNQCAYSNGDGTYYTAPCP